MIPRALEHTFGADVGIRSGLNSIVKGKLSKHKPDYYHIGYNQEDLKVRIDGAFAESENYADGDDGTKTLNSASPDPIRGASSQVEDSRIDSQHIESNKFSTKLKFDKKFSDLDIAHPTTISQDNSNDPEKASGGTINANVIALQSDTASKNRKQIIKVPTKSNLVARTDRIKPDDWRLLVPSAAFARIVRNRIKKQLDCPKKVLFSQNALLCLQEASERYICGVLCECSLAASHAKRVTIMPKDMALVMRIRNDKHQGLQIENQSRTR